MGDDLEFDPIEFEIDFATYVNMACDHLSYEDAHEQARKEYIEDHNPIHK